MVPSRDSYGDEPIGELLQRLRPEIERILVSFDVPESAATDILQEVMVVLAYRWDRVNDREAWLLATIRRRCARWREELGGSSVPN